jgi:UPF0716 protein FxsA
MPVLLGLLAWPLIEIALFVTVGGWLGLWLTLAIVLGTGIAGVALMRWRGLRAMADLRTQVRNVRNPLPMVADQGMFMLAGILLILPGFLTDILGLVLLIPPVRTVLIGLVARHVVVNRGPRARRQAADVIEGDYTEVDVPASTSNRPSGWTQD